MGHNELPYLSIDRANEDADLADEDFDIAVAAAARFNAADLRNKARNGDAGVLASLDDELAHRLGGTGVAVQLIQTALAFGPAAAGQLLSDLIQKGVDALAEIAALAEVESRARETA